MTKDIITSQQDDGLERVARSLMVDRIKSLAFAGFEVVKVGAY